MTSLNLRDILTALDAAKPADAEQILVSGAKVDSRQIEPGDMFVAMRGETTDGHAYIQAAFDAGATVALVERPIAGTATIDTTSQVASSTTARAPVQVVVANTLDALQKIAAWWRQEHDVTVIGVTGSVGKTTAKEIIARVLAQRFCTLRNPGNYNNEIGLPLTLLSLRADHQCVVLEMGMYALGEIAQLARIAAPQIGVVMNVEPVHLERLGSIERIAQAKGELIEALPENGLAVLYGDDSRVRSMSSLSAARSIQFGMEPTNEFWASDLKSAQLAGSRFVAHAEQKDDAYDTLPLSIGVPGRHVVLAALAAVGIARHLGMSWPEIARGLDATQDSLRLTPKQGRNGSLILDDTYNASPLATRAAFDLLRDLNGRRIAVLGDMLELGEYEDQAHHEVGREGGTFLDELITVGTRAELIAQSALKAGMPPEHVTTLHTNQEAVTLLADILCAGDVVLVKGSRGMAMETIVQALLQEGES